MNFKTSIEGRLLSIMLLATLLAVSVIFVSAFFIDDLVAAVFIALPLSCLLSVWLVRMVARSVNGRVKALGDGLLSLMDNDFSVTITNQYVDDLSEVLDTYNRLVEKSRRERQYIYQRELLLDTVIQHSSMCVVLTDQTDRIIYSNHHAKTLLNNGKPINGLFFSDAITGVTETLKELLSQRVSGLFRVGVEGDDDLYHISSGQFILNAQQHNLLLIKEMTLELHRQEAAVWKKVIRTISHELNNSLAPISSMAHSGRLMLEKGKYDSLSMVFETIGERTDHLTQFIQSYASIAKLPLPQKQSVDWQRFIHSKNLEYGFTLDGKLPDKPGFFDPVQIDQVVVNLLKNAQESGSNRDDIFLKIVQNDIASTVEIVDRGSGMSAHIIENALLPFYTTKLNGSGIGLPLCREIIEAHGGSIALFNRDGGGLKVRFTLPF